MWQSFAPQLQAAAIQHSLTLFRTRYDYCRQKTVEIMLDNKEVLTGVAQGVTDRAELRVTIEGKEQIFNSADISVRSSLE